MTGFLVRKVRKVRRDFWITGLQDERLGGLGRLGGLDDYMITGLRDYRIIGLTSYIIHLTSYISGLQDDRLGRLGGLGVYLFFEGGS